MIDITSQLPDLIDLTGVCACKWQAELLFLLHKLAHNLLLISNISARWFFWRSNINNEDKGGFVSISWPCWFSSTERRSCSRHRHDSLDFQLRDHCGDLRLVGRLSTENCNGLCLVRRRGSTAFL